MISIGKVSWPGPVGIAAGLIKGTAVFLDFSTKADSLEIGSITQAPLHGNSGQTIWRYPQEKGLRHHAGMPNPGSKEIVNQLKQAQEKIQIPWGINVATTPQISDIPSASQDIHTCVQNIIQGGLKPDWLTLNVSSPDTNDAVEMLSEPQRVFSLIQIIKPIISTKLIPLWIKLGASLSKSHYSQLGQIFIQEKVDAIICSNAIPDPNNQLGGWCGQPVKAAAQATLWELQQVTHNQIPIISVGGILSGKDVAFRLKAGAAATQVASALLLRGRTAAQDIHREHELLSTS